MCADTVHEFILPRHWQAAELDAFGKGGFAESGFQSACGKWVGTKIIDLGVDIVFCLGEKMIELPVVATNFHAARRPAPLMMKETAGVPSRWAEVAKTFDGIDRES